MGHNSDDGKEITKKAYNKLQKEKEKEAKKRAVQERLDAEKAAREAADAAEDFAKERYGALPLNQSQSRPGTFFFIVSHRAHKKVDCVREQAINGQRLPNWTRKVSARPFDYAHACIQHVQRERKNAFSYYVNNSLPCRHCLHKMMLL